MSAGAFANLLSLWQRGAHVAEHGPETDDDAHALSYYSEVAAKVQALGPALVIVRHYDALEAERVLREERIAEDAAERRRIIVEQDELVRLLGRAA